MKAALLLAIAAAVYVVAAWAVKPGFYDCCAAPQYDYVAPPPAQAPYNIPPTGGSGHVGPAGGTVTTKDQPIAQAGIRLPAGTLSSDATIHIQPFAPPHVAGITLEGNVYCIAADITMNAGATAQVTLLVPAGEPFPTAMYYAPSLNGGWKSIGGAVDLSTYLMSAMDSAFGCFAVGYPTPKNGGPGIRGQLVPLVTAVLIAIVILVGLPIAIRRRTT